MNPMHLEVPANKTSSLSSLFEILELDSGRSPRARIRVEFPDSAISGIGKLRFSCGDTLESVP